MHTVKNPWKLECQFQSLIWEKLKLGKVKETCTFIQFKWVSYIWNGKNVTREMTEMMDQIENSNWSL